MRDGHLPIVDRKIRRLLGAMGISGLIFAAEALGGIVSGSLALLSDAGHVLTDMLALGISFGAAVMARRAAGAGATFGYHRYGVLAAMVNGAVLILVAVAIANEAYERYLSPVTVGTTVMIWVAVGGLIGNLVMMRIIGHHGQDLSLKSAWLHIMGDTLSSVGVIVAAVVIHFTGLTVADLLASVLVAVIIIVGGTRVVRDALRVFLELSPPEMNPDAIVEAVRGTEGVLDVHDVHLWSITHGAVAFSAHVLVKNRPLSEVDAMRRSLEELMRGFGVDHTTLQMECADCVEMGTYCSLPGAPRQGA